MGGDGTAKAKKKQKVIRSDCGSDGDPSGDGRRADDLSSVKKKKKKKKKRHRGEEGASAIDGFAKRKKKKRRGGEESANACDSLAMSSPARYFPFEYQHVLAPMVGASELAFRLLCRKYGATLAYTPMMSAKQFVKEASEADLGGHRTVANANICDFQTIPEDRPLVCHFSANDPQDFVSAAKLVEPVCDAIDLNLGCPQRTAYLGHFGSYLLGNEDRQLVVNIVKAATGAVGIPIFVKIRLLDTVEETADLCRQLREAGASLVAIHARYRASWERTGPGARDGPAHLDQVKIIKSHFPDFPIISNGNVRTWDDVVQNQKLTACDGVMSAEGLLNNPALFLPRLGDEADLEIKLPNLSSLSHGEAKTDENVSRRIRKLRKKLREIDALEKKVAQDESTLDDSQVKKLRAKPKLQAKLAAVLDSQQSTPSSNGSIEAKEGPETIMLRQLRANGTNKLFLANEYLALVRRYPMKIRSVIFHIRRMCKELLEKYQLMEECVSCMSIQELEALLDRMQKYIENPDTFTFDQQKAKREKEAMSRKREEEGKRKRFEQRMMRKAKREGLPPEYYLKIGSEVPSVEMIVKLKSMPKEERLAAWKASHSQHCMNYHLEKEGCRRDRACAFLHVEARDKRRFDERDEVAG